MRIAELLEFFLPQPLSEVQLLQIASYLEILHRWNARMNLTAVREPEQMVTRHFGESLFAARALFPLPLASRPSFLVDIGSGAGFPGLPMKIWAPELDVTLVEAHTKKATFLKEVIRALELGGIRVANTRAEQFVSADADDTALTVTLRAVEKFEHVLPVATRIASRGRLVLLIGAAQVEHAHHLAPGVRWADPLPIPRSLARVVLVGESR